jgi:hypothetical protein
MSRKPVLAKQNSSLQPEILFNEIKLQLYVLMKAYYYYYYYWWDGVMWTGLVWLRIGTGGELL